MNTIYFKSYQTAKIKRNGKLKTFTNSVSSGFALFSIEGTVDLTMLPAVLSREASFHFCVALYDDFKV